MAISAVSNFLLAISRMAVAFGLHRWSSHSAASCTLIMLSPNILELSRWATPDCFATFVAALGMYLILERNLYFWGCSFLIFDIWVRTDALVSAGIVFLVLLLRGKLDFTQFASLSVLSLGSYFAINYFAGNYGWPALFYNSFMGGLTTPGETLVHFSRSAYLHQVVRGAYLWLISGSFALYLLLGGLAIWLNRIVTLQRIWSSQSCGPSGQLRALPKWRSALYRGSLRAHSCGPRDRRSPIHPASFDFHCERQVDEAPSADCRLLNLSPDPATVGTIAR